MIGPSQEIECKKNPRIKIKALKGHFALTNSHTNFYVDIIDVKHNQAQAERAAEVIAQDFSYQSVVDTIVCMDRSNVIGAYLAEALSKNDMYSLNRKKELYVISPELENAAQMIFRDNLQPHIRGKRILILCGNVLTGKSLQKAIECVRYYGGEVIGAAAVFSDLEEVGGVPVKSLFTPADVPGYDACLLSACSLCAAGQKIDALANSYGYSVIP